MRRAALLAALGVVVLAAAILFRLPVGLVLSRLPPELTYQAASGTVWSGRADGLRWRGQPLGRAEGGLSFLPLLTGRAAGRLSLTGPGMEADGRIGARRGELSLRRVTARAALSRLNLTDFFGAPLRGEGRAVIGRLTFGPGVCEAEGFRVETDALEQSLGAYGSGLILQGEGRCEGGDLVLPLSGSGTQGEVTATLRLAPSGRWVTTMNVKPSDARIGPFLTEAGFTERAPGVWSAERRGVLRELL